MSDPITHVLRAPLPWRPAKLTECGLTAKDHPTITVDEFVAKVNREGKQRASYSTCMTCWNTARRHFGEACYKDSPLEREMQWSRMHRNGDAHPNVNDELAAIAMLVNRHRQEFDELVDDHVQTVRVDFSAKKGARPS
jgi:hypothetical protein